MEVFLFLCSVVCCVVAALYVVAFAERRGVCLKGSNLGRVLAYFSFEPLGGSMDLRYKLRGIFPLDFILL